VTVLLFLKLAQGVSQQDREQVLGVGPPVVFIHNHDGLASATGRGRGRGVIQQTQQQKTGGREEQDRQQVDSEIPDVADCIAHGSPRLMPTDGVKYYTILIKHDGNLYKIFLKKPKETTRIIVQAF
jgi:hypothetical protein